MEKLYSNQSEFYGNHCPKDLTIGKMNEDEQKAFEVFNQEFIAENGLSYDIFLKTIYIEDGTEEE